MTARRRTPVADLRSRCCHAPVHQARGVMVCQKCGDQTLTVSRWRLASKTPAEMLAKLSSSAQVRRYAG